MLPLMPAGHCLLGGQHAEWYRLLQTHWAAMTVISNDATIAIVRGFELYSTAKLSVEFLKIAQLLVKKQRKRVIGAVF
jgi:hypothetical protein